ncbi:hypothetical protein ACP4OV_025167 [Aristida adscensionis]
MAGEDRLSNLGDDLLRRILYFAPAKEAAATSALSRRWRPLWRSSDAVNLAVRIHDDGGYCDDREAEEAFFSRRDAFVRAAKAALAAAGHVTRLTLHVEADHGYHLLSRFLTRGMDWRVDHDVAGDLVAHPAARRVEELRVAAVEPSDGGYPDHEVMRPGLREDYSIGPLPSATLRVLDLTRFAPRTTAAFPRLMTLRLRLCTMDPNNLQALLDAAPELTTVRLHSVYFTAPHQVPVPYDYHTTVMEEAPVVRLRFPAATALELLLCSGFQVVVPSRGGIEIDAPRLRSFRYKGLMRPFLLRPPAPDMARVDLHFVDNFAEHRRGDDDYDKDKPRVLFWAFVQSFTNARSLKLKVDSLWDIAVKGKAKRTRLLCAFPNVERLELGGMHDPAGNTAAVAIANLLRCCPAVRDLCLKLSTVPSSSDKDSMYGDDFLERKDRLDYEKSVSRFTSRRMISSDGCSGGRCGDVSDIPGLSGRSFPCLQSCLRRVRLQFRLDKSSFGVRLVNFFAANATVLEEICVDSGNRRLSEHMNLDVESWIAPSNACFRRKNVETSSWEFSKIRRVSLDSTRDLTNSATTLTVLPHQRE